MAINTIRSRVVGPGGSAVGGFNWPVAARLYEGNLIGVYPDDLISYASAGRLQVSSSPVVIDADACIGYRRWTAQSAHITRETDAGILGGLTRWKGLVETGFDNGLFGDLPVSLTDYSMVVLARVTTGSANNCLVNIGPSTTDRIMLYTSTTDLLAIQHNSSDVQTYATAVTVGDWLPVVVSYQESTKAMRVYLGSTTPVISATMTNSPTTSKLASLMMTRENTTELTGELALCAIWSRALHLDATALASAVEAVTSLANL